MRGNVDQIGFDAIKFFVALGSSAGASPGLKCPSHHEPVGACPSQNYRYLLGLDATRRRYHAKDAANASK